MAHVVDLRVVVLAPEERHRVERFPRSEDIARRGLALTFGNHPVLDSDLTPRMWVRPARDVSRGEHSGQARFQELIDLGANPQDIVIIDVGDQLAITDAFLLASAPNERQVLAIVDAIEERLLDLPEKAKPVRREGERGGRWVLLDYVDVVVHVQHTEEREFYALDRLWKDCPTIPFVDRDLVQADAVAGVAAPE